MEHINGNATVVEEKWLKDIFNIANQEKWKMDAHTISTLRNEIQFFLLSSSNRLRRVENAIESGKRWMQKYGIFSMATQSLQSWSLYMTVEQQQQPYWIQLVPVHYKPCVLWRSCSNISLVQPPKKRYIHGTYISIFFFHNFFSRRTEAVSCFFNILLSFLQWIK